MSRLVNSQHSLRVFSALKSISWLICRVHPSGAKAFLVNYRAGDGGRKAPNKRVVVGRAGRMTPDQARRRAQELLGRVAAGEDPAGERAEARGLPRLGEACEDYLKSGHGWAESTERGDRRYAELYLGDWLSRPLDGITRRVFPSRSSESGHVEELQAYYEAIGRAGGAKFWFHALRNCFITVAERELMLPRSLGSRRIRSGPSCPRPCRRSGATWPSS